jgi:hypothetical protein
VDHAHECCRGVEIDTYMGLAKSETELQDRASAYLKAELQKAEVTYAELAKGLKKRGFPRETEDSIKAKLKRSTFAATFLFACLAALEREGMRLEDLCRLGKCLS